MDQRATPDGDVDGEWRTSSLDEAGLDAARMAELSDSIDNDPHGDFRSLVVVRNGRLAFEGYFNGHDAAALHDIRSATKSITSALVGTAIADGLIDDEHTGVLAALAAHAPFAHDDARKRAMTVEHLLVMASGLDADEDRPASPGHEDRLWESADWLRYALDLPMSHAPGQTWAYASVDTFLLGAIIEDASGQTLADYARDRLFSPLGIERFRWVSTPTGRTVAQGNLFLRARDMAKIGQLYLDQGRWAGTQVLPEAWVDASLVERYAVPWDDYDAYGYGWYLHTLHVEGRAFPYFFASGNGGNKIYVLPQQRMVVAIQSAAYNTPYGQRRSLDVFRRVLAAVTG